MSKSQDYWNIAVRWFLIIFVIDDVLKATTIPLRLFPSPMYSFWSTGIGLIAILLTLAGIFLFFAKKNKSKQELFRFILLSALCVISFVTFIYSSKFGWANNIRSLAWILFFFVVVGDLFGLDKNVMNNRYKIITLWVLNISWTAVTLYSLSSMFFSMPMIYDQQSIVITQGQMNGRLYGYFFDPNYAALYSTLVMLFTFWLISKSKRIWTRLYLIASVVVFFSYIIGAESRSGIIALAAGLGWLISFKLYKSINSNKYILKFTLSMLTLLTAVGASLALQIIDFSITSGTTSSIAGEETSKVSDARGYGATNDFSNGRLNIWKEYAELPSDAYLIGYSPGNLLEKIQASSPGLNISKNPTVPHNTAINALVSVGALGLISIIMLFGSYLRIAWKTYKMAYRFEDAISLSVVLATFIGVMFLNDVLFVNTVGALILFFALRTFSNKQEIATTNWNEYA